MAVTKIANHTRKDVMNNITTTGLLMLFTSTVTAADAVYTINIVPNQKHSVYQVGQEAELEISVLNDGQPVHKGTVSFVVDDFLNRGNKAGLPEGTAALTESPVRISLTGRRPEFLRCHVTFQPPSGKPVRAVAGVAFSPSGKWCYVADEKSNEIIILKRE